MNYRPVVFIIGTIAGALVGQTLTAAPVRAFSCVSEEDLSVIFDSADAPDADIDFWKEDFAPREPGANWPEQGRVNTSVLAGRSGGWSIRLVEEK